LFKSQHLWQHCLLGFIMISFIFCSFSCFYFSSFSEFLLYSHFHLSVTVHQTYYFNNPSLLTSLLSQHKLSKKCLHNKYITFIVSQPIKKNIICKLFISFLMRQFQYSMNIKLFMFLSFLIF
jgi:hypothetical protein